MEYFGLLSLAVQTVNVFQCFTHIPPVYFDAVADKCREEGFIADIVDHTRYAEATFRD